jgi:hypothetical protein
MILHCHVAMELGKEEEGGASTSRDREGERTRISAKKGAAEEGERNWISAKKGRRRRRGEEENLKEEEGAGAATKKGKG